MKRKGETREEREREREMEELEGYRDNALRQRRCDYDAVHSLNNNVYLSVAQRTTIALDIKLFCRS